MTTLPPFQPDMPGATGLFASGGAAPPDAATAPGTGLDFAGLLGAALPSAVPLTQWAASPVPEAVMPDEAVAGDAAAAATDTATPAPSPPLPQLYATPAPEAASRPAPGPALLPVLPGGKILPEPGARLPHLAPLAAAPGLQEAIAPLPPATPVPGTAVTSAPIPRGDPRVAVAGLERPATGRVSRSPLPAFVAMADAPVTDAAPLAPAPDDGADDSIADPVTSAADPALPGLALPDPALPDPALIAAFLPPPGNPPPPAPVRPLIAAAPLSGARAALPVRAAGLPIPSDDASSAEPTPAPSPAPTLVPAAAALPELAAPEPQPASAPMLALPPVAPASAPDRAEPNRAPAPQIESSIAQVGVLREALRTARPEMTLHHADFGHVSLRLEATGTQDWRAVLTSRDPGFVPAIHAALAERAVAAASASADSGLFSGQNAMGQNGTSDQRYGASPNGGQAGSQPYLGQSAHRDGEAAPDHRRTSIAAALAAREQEREGESGSEARGLFA